tara:strand:+ start:12 stop:221 length:210 start_codon:yes stop_codon:yes gene_type:complete
MRVDLKDLNDLVKDLYIHPKSIVSHVLFITMCVLWVVQMINKRDKVSQVASTDEINEAISKAFQEGAEL